jgi:ABC-type Mn2+/Zn2+ transport system ATPase subunit
MELIRLQQALIGYSQPLLAPLDLSVRRGERLAVLGPNGGGKTTLLKSLIGLLPLLGGTRVHPEERERGRKPRVGYVPQAHRADPVFPLTAEQVVLQGRYGLVGVGRFVGEKDRAAARAQLEKVGLLDRAAVPFRALSGGQRQRVLLARALCGEPDALVLDEFTSDLDPAAAAALLDEVSKLAEQTQVAVIFVTHEIASAATHSSQVALVDTRRRIFETGETAALLTSERMSALYGQPVTIERRGDRTVVFVEAGPSRPRP